MKAYAALVSLSHVLGNILQHHGRNWVDIDREQIGSLHEKICSLIDFLEVCSRQMVTKFDTDGLESQIAAACCAAEDIIESFIIDQIRQGEDSFSGSSLDIQKVIEEMDDIERKVAKIKEEMSVLKDQQTINSVPAAGLSRPTAPSGETTTVGLEDHLLQIKERLTGQESELQMISIVGMAGIGKTTLARNVYDNSSIIDHFDKRAWVTISPEYTVREILLTLLREVENHSYKDKQDRDENISALEEQMSAVEQQKNAVKKTMRVPDEEKTVQQLGEKLYKRLFRYRYLIIMDDMWSTDAWNEVRLFFPNNFNRSRVMITTRLSGVATVFGSDDPHEMDFLNEDKSWNLFRTKVFPHESFPSELEEIGKKIAKSCKGLPLALVVIGGLLAKSEMKREYWEHVAKNLTSIINLESDEQCLKILSLSYNHLPIHLKPCFLYMAAFPEDCEIHISRLIKLWIAEGLLKPIKRKSLEEVGIEYLRDLIDRNLIVVHKRGTTGKLKSCIMHDLVRDLCLKEAQRENFLCACKVGIAPDVETMRRICIHQRASISRHRFQLLDALQSASFARSVVCKFEWISHKLVSSLKLLRVLDVVDQFDPEEVRQLVNSRYLAFKSTRWSIWSPYSVLLFWNLQTLIVHGSSCIKLPSKFWEMTQLRHIEGTRIVLPNFPLRSHSGTKHSYIMENLKTLSTVSNFESTKEVLKRVPNLKILKILYTYDVSCWELYYLYNLVLLRKLESLSLTLQYPTHNFAAEYIAFPHSLKKLHLSGCGLPWEDITVVGSLPNLELLKLEKYAFRGSEWNAIEGEFVQLKFLIIIESDLKYWKADKTHFPSLEFLVLDDTKLEELPLGLEDHPKLRLIQLNFPYEDSIISSAKQILEDLESMGNEDLQIQVRPENGKEYYLTSGSISDEV